MKKATKILILLIATFLVMQMFRPKYPDSTPAKNLRGVQNEVNTILEKACFDCHSSNVNLLWYDKITPFNFMVASDVEKGRKALNFSKWDSLTTPQQNAQLYYALNKVLAGEMPLPAYTAVHPSAKLKESEILVLKQYLLSRTPRKVSDSAEISTKQKQYTRWLKENNTIVAKKVAPSPNGIEYIPDYRSWKAISTTDRFDNGTMRIIFGNEIAVNAIMKHKTNPWPDGAILAKTAWKQQVGEDGNITTGNFIQVEFMIKDAKKYKKTEGWGWARWKGEELKPYGKTGVERECISCHKPVKNNDNVFTVPLNLGSTSILK